MKRRIAHIGMAVPIMLLAVSCAPLDLVKAAQNTGGMINAPIVTVIAATVDTTPTWTWTKPAGTSEFRIQLDSESGSWTEVTGSDLEYTPGALALGQHALYVRAVDLFDHESVSGSASTAIVEVSSNLAAYYPFSGNANDASGNNRHATVSGASLTNDRVDNPSSAYLFSHLESDSISIPITDTNLSSQTAWSIACWVYLDAAQGSATVPVWQAGDGCGLQYLPDYGQLHTSIRTSDSSSRGSKANDILTDRWYFAAVVMDPALKIYVDGQYKESDFGSTAMAPLGLNISLGYWETSAWYLSGKVDEVRIYYRALSADEILALYLEN